MVTTMADLRSRGRHPALADTAHVPWTLPRAPWALTMRWEELLFLHWRVDAARLAACVPDGLELETFDGSAWLGVVPFRMAAVRARWLPPLPTAHTFPELNVRTYVRAGGRSGVWFFSLDASSSLAVAGARAVFGLPYFRATMECAANRDGCRYRSQRTDRRGPAARFAATWRPLGPGVSAEPGSLVHFLVERYCLFARRRGRLVRGDVVHAPWDLAPVDLQLAECDMTRSLGLELTGPPDSALVTTPRTVAAWAPVHV
jgi:hypothetical protein